MLHQATELFGFLAVTSMVVTYALEQRSHWFVLAFATSCGAASLYAVLIHSWPFAAVEGVWAIVAFRRWLGTRARAATGKSNEKGSIYSK